jgi:hypothetical protein
MDKADIFSIRNGPGDTLVLLELFLVAAPEGVAPRFQRPRAIENPTQKDVPSTPQVRNQHHRTISRLGWGNNVLSSGLRRSNDPTASFAKHNWIERCLV